MYSILTVFNKVENVSLNFIEKVGEKVTDTTLYAVPIVGALIVTVICVQIHAWISRQRRLRLHTQAIAASRTDEEPDVEPDAGLQDQADVPLVLDDAPALANDVPALAIDAPASANNETVRQALPVPLDPGSVEPEAEPGRVEAIIEVLRTDQPGNRDFPPFPFIRWLFTPGVRLGNGDMYHWFTDVADLQKAWRLALRPGSVTFVPADSDADFQMYV